MRRAGAGRVDVRQFAMRLPRDRTGALAYPKVEAAERAAGGLRGAGMRRKPRAWARPEGEGLKPSCPHYKQM